MKEAIFEVFWHRQKGKMKKNGTTYVIHEDCQQAIEMFIQQYPDRVIQSVYRTGDDILQAGRAV